MVPRPPNRRLSKSINTLGRRWPCKNKQSPAKRLKQMLGRVFESPSSAESSANLGYADWNRKEDRERKGKQEEGTCLHDL